MPPHLRGSRMFTVCLWCIEQVSGTMITWVSTYVCYFTYLRTALLCQQVANRRSLTCWTQHRSYNHCERH